VTKTVDKTFRVVQLPTGLLADLRRLRDTTGTTNSKLVADSVTKHLPAIVDQLRSIGLSIEKGKEVDSTAVLYQRRHTQTSSGRKQRNRHFGDPITFPLLSCHNFCTSGIEVEARPTTGPASLASQRKGGSEIVNNLTKIVEQFGGFQKLASQPISLHVEGYIGAHNPGLPKVPYLSIINSACWWLGVTTGRHDHARLPSEFGLPPQYEHWAVGQPDHFFGDTAQQHSRHSAPPVRWDDDQVGFLSRRIIGDCGPGVSK
jgi:hypothetical protein